MMGRIGAVWGIGGFVLLLVFAIYRLGQVALQAFNEELFWHHWLVLVISLLFMAYSEGYRGFQQNYSPRVAARARYLRAHPTLLRVCLAPLFCMGYFHAPKRRVVSACVLTIMIIAFITIFHYLPQPWRGLLDASVVLGLSWGLVATLLFSARALLGDEFKHSPEVVS